MTDEVQREDQAADTPATEEQPTPAEAAGNGEAQEQEQKKLEQTVELRDIGPCKKHIKVTVGRPAIDERIGEKIKELVTDSFVPGFRPGKAPKKVVEKRYYKDVADQVKTEVLLASLEQLAEEQDIAPLSAPDINPNNLELPKEGPFVYEFEVEVRPQFDLPEYKGLKLKRPVKTFTDDDVNQEQRRVLTPYGQVVPKPEGNAEPGDVLVADVTFRDGEQAVGETKELTIRVEKQLAFKDGMARDFAERVRGANAGDQRTVDVVLSSQAANAALRGKAIQMQLDIKDVKTVRLPELEHEFLHNFGVHSPDQFRELIQVLLHRRLEYQQRQAAREQVLSHIAAAATWELPRDLLIRQARKAMARRVMEMRADGIPDEEIQGRQRLMQQDILQSTALALKEHFVLQKIAEVEKIEVDDEDLEAEIERLADQSGESPRRVRARLEKEDLLDALAAEMIERKALDLILASAEYEDVPLDQETPAVATVEEQAVPGAMRDLDAESQQAEASEGQSPAGEAAEQTEKK